MKTLVVNRSGKLEIAEVPIPEYNEYQALVKTVSCGICNGTDAKLIHKTFKGYSEENYPLMLGHEAVGKVVEIGSKVTSYKIGDYVLLPFTDANDSYNSAWGAFSEYGVVNDAAALSASGYKCGDELFPECAFGQQVIPEDFDPVDASMIITFREVLSSIKRFGIKENSSIVVFGAGPVGLTFIKFMKLLGVSPIICFDINDNKIIEAKRMGADYAFNLTKENVEERVHSICPKGVQFVLDAVGKTDIINQAMGLIDDHGTICCYGISPNTSMNIDWTKAPYNWTVQFQQFPSKYDESCAHDQVIDWMKSDKINIKDFISDIFDFSDILTAFGKMEQREIAKKAIIRY